MSTSNFPTATVDNQPPRKDNKNIIIAVLAIALVGLGIYSMVGKNKATEVIQQQEATISKDSTQISEIQKSFDGSLARLDSLGTVNTALSGKLEEKNKEIAKQKAEIRSILNKKNATAAELAKAKTLIADLNGKISSMEQEVARLTQENQTLTTANAGLTQDKEKLTQDLTTTTVAKEGLEKKVDVASTLNASNIQITAFNVKKNGKEKETTTAKRVDKIVISFDVSNRIIQSGMTDVYVCVIGPDGKPVSAEKLGSGNFSTREDGDKPFTAKVSVDLQTGTKKNVDFAFNPGDKFQVGSYTIQIYHNGFKIGEGVRTLKKGGLFS
jgi:hypothetical protein